MVNRRYADEWLEKAKHDLEGAKILYQAGHYSDIKNILDLSETLLLDIQKITHANLDDN